MHQIYTVSFVQCLNNILCTVHMYMCMYVRTYILMYDICGLCRCTVLDVALKEGYTEIADLLIKSGACTSNGRHHRAACLIQAVWRFHRHKVI